MTNSNIEDFVCFNDAIFDKYWEIMALRGGDFPLKKELYGEEANKWGEPIKYWGSMGLAFETPVDAIDFSPELAYPNGDMREPVEGIVILHWATEESKKEAAECWLEYIGESGPPSESRDAQYSLWLIRKLEKASLEEKIKHVRYNEITEGNEDLDRIYNEVMWDVFRSCAAEVKEELEYDEWEKYRETQTDEYMVNGEQ